MGDDDNDDWQVLYQTTTYSYYFSVGGFFKVFSLSYDFACSCSCQFFDKKVKAYKSIQTTTHTHLNLILSFRIITQILHFVGLQQQCSGDLSVQQQPLSSCCWRIDSKTTDDTFLLETNTPFFAAYLMRQQVQHVRRTALANHNTNKFLCF